MLKEMSLLATDLHKCFRELWDSPGLLQGQICIKALGFGEIAVRPFHI